MPDELSYRCPYCDREARVGSPCPGCAEKSRQAAGSTKKQPWQQDAGADGLDLPDNDFDYEDFVAREFGRLPHRRLGVKWFWWLLGGLALAAIIASSVVF